VSRPRLPYFAFAASMLVAGSAGCGGGGSSFVSTPPPPPSPALVITTVSPLPRAILGKTYSATLQATGGTAPYTWSSQLLGIPGMALSSDGVLSGTPTQQSTFIPTITVSDSKSRTASASIELDVLGQLAFSTQALGDLNIALPASNYITATGGVQPYTFALKAGSSMPPGLTFTSSNSAGLIQGTPTTPGKYSFTVQVTDSFSPPMQVTQTFSLNILNGLVVPNTTLPDAVQNLAYHEQIKAAGGTPPYHYVLGQFSSMPPGLSLDTNTGIVAGTPTAASQFPDALLVLITDSAPTPAMINPFITINVQPRLAFQQTTFSDCTRTFGCGGGIGIVGGRAPYTIALTSGALPDGVSLSLVPVGSTFNLSGIATKDGTFAFTLKVTDSYETPSTATQSFQIRVSDQLAISGPGLVQLLFNQSYSGAFPATGGIPPYKWKMATVPPGFTFDTSTGNLSGTGVGGTFADPNVTVQDSSNPPQTATYFSFVLDVYAKLNILTSSLPPVAVGGNTYLELITSITAAPYTWSITAGAPPPGISLVTTNAMGLLKGTPTAAGTYQFTIRLVDGNTGNLQQTVSVPLTLVVKNPAQIGRNDSPATATPVSNINLLASISPYSDPQSTGADADFYAASAVPGSIVQIYTAPNNDFLQPPEPNSMQPVLEVVDATGKRYQTCAPAQPLPTQGYNFACVNNLPGSFLTSLQGNFYSFQVPGTGTASVTFYIRVSDARGDARPDFIYTLGVFGVN